MTNSDWIQVILMPGRTWVCKLLCEVWSVPFIRFWSVYKFKNCFANQLGGSFFPGRARLSDYNGYTLMLRKLFVVATFDLLKQPGRPKTDKKARTGRPNPPTLRNTYRTFLVGFSKGVPMKWFDDSCSTIFGIPKGCVSKLRNLQICSNCAFYKGSSGLTLTSHFGDTPKPSTISCWRFSRSHGHHVPRTESEDLRRWWPHR